MNDSSKTKNIVRDVFSCLLFLVAYLLLQPELVQILNTLWVNNIISELKLTSFFDIVCCLSLLMAIWQSQYRKFYKIEWLIPLLYIDFRFVRPEWDYPTLFTHRFDNKFTYLDFIPFYYLLSYVIRIIKKNRQRHRLNASTVTSPYIDDHPIHTAKDDLYGRKRMAESVVMLMHRIKSLQDAGAIGISGYWGAGKTSMLKLIENELQHTGANDYTFFHFSPWMFLENKSIIIHFFDELEKELRKEDASLADIVSDYANALNDSGGLLWKLGLSSLIRHQTSLEHRHKRLQKALKKKDQCLVVIIDDLDRLHAKEVVDILKLIRIVGDFPNLLYIVGYDREYVEHAIAKEISEYAPDKYLSKIFSYEFQLPTLSDAQVRERFFFLMEERMNDFALESLKLDPQIIRLCVSFEHLTLFLKSERDIKKFINHVLNRYALIGSEVNFQQFFYLELLLFFEKEVYHQLFEMKPAGIFKRIDSTDGFEKMSIRSREVIHTLFGDSGKRQYLSIADEIFFNRYFMLSIPNTEFSGEEFAAIFSEPDRIGQRLIELNGKNSTLFRSHLNKKYLAIDALTKMRKEELPALFELRSVLDATMTGPYLKRFEIDQIIINLIRQSDIELSISLPELIRELPEKQHPGIIEFLNCWTERWFEDQHPNLLESFKHISKSLQIELFNKYLASSEVSDYTLLPRLEQLAKFDTSDGWYLRDILSKCVAHLRNFERLDVLLREETGMKRLSQGALSGGRRIFGSLANLIALFPDLDDGIEKLIDPFFKMKTGASIYYKFQERPFGNKAKYNDDLSFPIRDLKLNTHYRLIVKGIDTSTWRLGIRFYKDENIITNQELRHKNDLALWVLCRGSLVSNPDLWTDESSSDIHYTMYNGQQELTTQEIEPAPNSGFLYFVFNVRDQAMSARGFTASGTEVVNGSFNFGRTGFTQFQLIAWRDYASFQVKLIFGEII